MPGKISGSVFSHSSTPLLAGTAPKRSQSLPDLSGLQIASGPQIPSRPIHAISVESIDLSDSQVRQQIAELLTIVCDRLNLMPQMGVIKMTLGDNPLDETQEERVLQASVKVGVPLGLPEELVRSFIQGQMTVAKSIQKVTMDSIQSPSGGYSESDKLKANQDKQELREKIKTKLKPLLEALKPLADNLQTPGVQNEIARQLHRGKFSGECAKQETREWIRDSLKQVRIPTKADSHSHH